MGKGASTRESILQQAVDLASLNGLSGLTIGSLADHARLSKSGLFAHFGSKEALQIAVLEAAAERFNRVVVKPAWRAPRGVARLRAIFEHWLEWERTESGRGGCVFFAASAELDDRDGPVRDTLVAIQRQWRDALARVARRAAEIGELRPDLDAEQFAHDLFGIMFAFHFAGRLMREPDAELRVRNAFDALLMAASRPHVH
jgi:AcrR family transcriptional regulator